jgi:pimeloyl-ACP methyl ester carboxylesterase
MNRSWKRRLAAASCCLAALAGCRTVAPAPAPVLAPAAPVPLAYSSSGEGDPTLVLLHCWSCDRHLWDDTAAALAATHRVVTIDLPGHGASAGLAPRAGWTIAGLAEEVAGRIETLQLRRVVLVGSSMGAAVALDAAARLPGRALGVVVVDAVQNADFVLPEETWRKLVTSLETDFPGACGSFVARLFGPEAAPELIEARIADMCDADPAVALPLLRDLAAASEPEMLRRAGVPVRGINGDQYPTDEAANRKYADYRATVIAGSGHFPMVEKPVEFRAALERWAAEFASR